MFRYDLLIQKQIYTPYTYCSRAVKKKENDQVKKADEHKIHIVVEINNLGRTRNK